MTKPKIKLSEIENIAENMHVGDITRHEIKSLCRAVRAAKDACMIPHNSPWGGRKAHEILQEALSAFDWSEDE